MTHARRLDRFATVSALLNVVTAIGVVPRLVARYCIARSVYIGHTWQCVTMILLSLPWINRHRVLLCEHGPPGLPYLHVR